MVLIIGDISEHEVKNKLKRYNLRKQVRDAQFIESMKEMVGGGK